MTNPKYPYENCCKNCLNELTRDECICPKENPRNEEFHDFTCSDCSDNGPCREFARRDEKTTDVTTDVIPSKLCPFSLGVPSPSYCHQKRCMAWETEHLKEEGGYCKLIDRVKG